MLRKLVKRIFQPIEDLFDEIHRDTEFLIDEWHKAEAKRRRDETS